MVVNKKNIIQFLKKPMPAVALTNEWLIVSGGTGIMLTALLIVFSGNIETSSDILTDIVSEQNKRVQEKIALISADYNNTNNDTDYGVARFVLSNYGNVQTNIIEMFDISTPDGKGGSYINKTCTMFCTNRTGSDLTDCLKRQPPVTDFPIAPNSQITISCIGIKDNNTVSEPLKQDKMTAIGTGSEILFVTEYRNILNAKVLGPPEFKVEPRNVTDIRVILRDDDSVTGTPVTERIDQSSQDRNLRITQLLYNVFGYHDPLYKYKIVLNNGNTDTTTIVAFSDKDGDNSELFNNNCIKGTTGSTIIPTDKIIPVGDTVTFHCKDDINIGVNNDIRVYTTKGFDTRGTVEYDRDLSIPYIQKVELIDNRFYNGSTAKITFTNGLSQPIGITGSKNTGDEGSTDDEAYQCSTRINSGPKLTGSKSTSKPNADFPWTIPAKTTIIIECLPFNHDPTNSEFYKTGQTFKLFTNNARYAEITSQPIPYDFDPSMLTPPPSSGLTPCGGTCDINMWNYVISYPMKPDKFYMD